MRRGGSERHGGPGSTGGARGNILWGGDEHGLKIRLALLLVAVTALVGGGVDQAGAAKSSAFVPDSLREAAEARPGDTFDVIVQGDEEASAGDVAAEVGRIRADIPGKGVGVVRRFATINGSAAQLTGRQVLKLAEKSGILAITEDAPAAPAAYGNPQVWPEAAGARSWDDPPAGTTYPTIAIVDSGVEPRAEFGSRLLAQVSFVTNGPNSPGDGRGHGTLVASIAANGGSAYTGAEPRANIVSLDVLDDNGVGRVSDILAACDWILKNKDTYDIRVANFSLNAGGTIFWLDPLNRAVEALWLNGVVVVAAAGNYGTEAGPSRVVYSPASDPFVITVGASDVNGTPDTRDDTPAPWSAWGHTPDGFFKPELAAPGRWMRGAVPASSSLKASFPERSLEGGYMWMSGTSFAAPVVSGIAATILSRNPTWTPDQVKGALMLTTGVPDGYGAGGALGVGVVDGKSAMSTSSPPNPNAALGQFVYTDSTGLRRFRGLLWQLTALTNPSWASASWSSASWANASWSSASWANASWSSASWSSASWSSASWASASWANNADSETEPEK